MERFEKKLDDLLSGQNEQALAIRGLQDILNNGIRAEIKASRECVERLESVCMAYESRLQILERFSWFREFVTKFRDNFIENMIKIIALGSLVFLATHFGDQIVKKMWG